MEGPQWLNFTYLWEASLHLSLRRDHLRKYSLQLLRILQRFASWMLIEDTHALWAVWRWMFSTCEKHLGKYWRFMEAPRWGAHMTTWLDLTPNATFQIVVSGPSSFSVRFFVAARSYFSYGVRVRACSWLPCDTFSQASSIRVIRSRIPGLALLLAAIARTNRV